MSTELDLDIATLVGEMEAPACDHSQHGNHEYHSDEPASHYVRSHCPGCTEYNRVYPACPRFVETLTSHEFFQCSNCGEVGLLPEFITVLGRVSS